MAYGKSHWIADGFCDDINNNEACNYDGGDCCGSSVQKHFCIDCECVRKFDRSSLIYNCMNWFIPLSLQKFADFTCSNDADCNNGFCRGIKCVCQANHNYLEDCSLFGRKYLTWISLKCHFSKLSIYLMSNCLSSKQYSRTKWFKPITLLCLGLIVT